MLRQSVGQRFSLDEFQHQPLNAVALFDAVDGGDVRMVQRGDHARLALEARDPVRVGGELGGQHLDRDVTTELGVVGAVDLAHAAATQECVDLETSQPPPGEILRGRAFGWSGAYASHERRSRNRLPEEVLDVAVQFVIAGRRTGQKGCALRLRAGLRCVVQVLDALPAFGGHGHGIWTDASF